MQPYFLYIYTAHWKALGKSCLLRHYMKITGAQNEGAMAIRNMYLTKLSQLLNGLINGEIIQSPSNHILENLHIVKT